MTRSLVSIPASPSLRDLLRVQAQDAPGAVALLAPGWSALTYGGLQVHVERLAHALTHLGVRPHSRVVLVLPDGPEMVMAVLAVASVAACAPLNPGSTAHELAAYLDEIRPGAVIVPRETDSPVRSVARARGIAILELSALLAAEAGGFELSTLAPQPAARHEWATADEEALVLVTSGTTARPKTVPLTHRNVLTGARDMAVALGLGPADRLLSIMPLFHSHGLVSTVLASLVAGGSAVCTPGFSSASFFDWLGAFVPTWYSAVPTMHRSILRAARGRADLPRPRPLRFIRSSSAALAPPVLAELERVFGVPVIEAYGTTEVSSIACNPLPPRPRKPGSVGIATGPEIAILDEAGSRAAAGTMGEVAVRGPSVIRSYGDAVTDAEAFVHGWWRTGDLGMLDAEGYLVLAGRLGDLVNRGGMKVAPLEVEAVFLDHPAVAEAVTFPVPHVRWGQDVMTAVVLRPGARATEHDLRAFAATRLAMFKVPSQVRIVTRLPEGATGKVQRRSLAEQLGLTGPHAHDEAAPTAPRTPLEAELARLMTTVLGRPRVGIHDNFFRLGGDSLLAAQVVSRIHQAASVDLSLRSFFEHPTVAELADLLFEQQVGALERDTLAHLLAALEGP